ncbi:hypothetical protein LKI01_15020 [Companilactobacillus paralimentarius]|nr:hypothetical protein LKI01_15020 [Companilactobacillus paralimentarius]
MEYFWILVTKNYDEKSEFGLFSVSIDNLYLIGRLDDRLKGKWIFPSCYVL